MAAKDRKPKRDHPGQSGAKQSADAFKKVGPLSTEGVEAGDLEDGGRGDVDKDPRKVAQRKPPDRTGENTTGDVGLRGTPDIAEAEQHGGRKRN
jgi:hypothetical protein